MKEIFSTPPKVNKQVARGIVEVGDDDRVTIFPAVESDAELRRVMDALRRELILTGELWGAKRV